VSVRPAGEAELGTRTEIKNLNSFRFIEKAIEHEVERQIDILEQGGKVSQETRLYDSDRDETRSMRSKEEANDYRYFPDPDLLPVELDDAFIQAVRADLPELPDAKRARFAQDYGLKESDIVTLTINRDMADYFEAVANALIELSGDSDPKLAANWVIGELSGALNKDGVGIRDGRISARDLAGMLQRIHDGTISGKIAKEVFEAMWQGEGSADQVIESRGLKQISDTGELGKIVDTVLADNPDQAEQYRGGKTKVLGYLVGQVMQATRGKANPAQVNELLRSKLS
jgi:aspartyl-tRNA(Asn)/glutamyl-tRNA(Gln) amidotransferase subunit B